MLSLVVRTLNNVGIGAMLTPSLNFNNDIKVGEMGSKRRKWWWLAYKWGIKRKEEKKKKEDVGRRV